MKYILILLLLFGAGCQRIDTPIVVGGGTESIEQPAEKPVIIDSPIELKVDGVVLEKVQFNALKSSLASKIKEDGVDITMNELNQIKDTLAIQSKQCGEMRIDGVLDWAAIKKILEMNCIK